MRVAIPVAALGWLVFGAACEVQTSSSLSGAAQAIEPYREQFMSFDAWARRAQATARVTPNRAALDEATFAPIRNASAILAAWVELPQSTLAMPASAAPPGATRWVTLRDDRLGAIRVAAAERCPVELPRWWREGRGEGPCILASRGQKTHNDRELVVTVAFAARP